jgi:hypothetical protein
MWDLGPDKNGLGLESGFFNDVLLLRIKATQ